jgi:hypothetical protein
VLERVFREGRILEFYPGFEEVVLLNFEIMPGFPHSAMDPQSCYPFPRFISTQRLIMMIIKLCGSLGKITMATQVQLQALLGSHHILLLIKKAFPRSIRILQELCDVTEECLSAEYIYVKFNSVGSKKPYIVKSTPLAKLLLGKI